MKIEWQRVTKLSQVVAIALFVGVFVLAFQLGRMFQTQNILGEKVAQAEFVCAGGEKFVATFYDRMVELLLIKGKRLYLPQTMSASGARYASKDESIVFWNKGDTAFIEQNGEITIKDCKVN